MEIKKLFPQVNGILHGGDYNPEQWLDRPDILEEDVHMMREAGINCVSLGIFSWAVYEPVEGEYHFEWLVDCIDRLYENGIYTILATPSAARPAWLDETYPEAMRVDSYGIRYHHGVRHNHCMSSLIYRKKVKNIIERLHEAVGEHPGVILWHVSNEFGGECFCSLCVKKFQMYLEQKFEGDITKLNHAWWTTFWSHQYNRFDQIEPPYRNGEYSVMGLLLEWRRFTTRNMTDYMNFEINLLKKLTPNRPVTTNYMQLYEGLDYREMSKELDMISWDSYPVFHNDYESLEETMLHNSFDHAVMRCIKKDRPFMMMESAPGLVNWHQYNKIKRPGIHRLFSLHALACGSDTVQYFQWRKGRGSYEQYHGAVVDHLGTNDTRIFRDVAALGEELRKFSEIQGSLVKAEVALIFDWDVMWAIGDMKGLADETKQYAETCMKLYAELLKLGVEVDVIPQTDSFEEYRVLIAPMLYLLKPGVAKRMTSFVEQGGELLATYLTGYVDQDTLCFLGGFPGDGLKDLFGVVSEEIDTLYPADKNGVSFINGASGVVRDYAELLRPGNGTAFTGRILGKYTSDFYADTAAVTLQSKGKGHACYVGCRLDEETMKDLFGQMLERATVVGKKLPEHVMCHVRKGDQVSYEFYLNTGLEKCCVESVAGYNLNTGKPVCGILELEPLDVVIIRK